MTLKLKITVGKNLLFLWKCKLKDPANAIWFFSFQLSGNRIFHMIILWDSLIFRDVAVRGARNKCKCAQNYFYILIKGGMFCNLFWEFSRSTNLRGLYQSRYWHKILVCKESQLHCLLWKQDVLWWNGKGVEGL